MGVVYSAEDPALDRHVALKVLRRHLTGTDGGGARMEDRLLREAQSMARLAHPNVVAVFDAGRFEEQLFIAMELVAGCTMTEWLREKDRSAPEIIAAYVQAGRGLAAAHAAGILHRDFKPENVLVGRDGRVRVTDFGLARSLEQPAAGAAPWRGAALETRLTVSGAFMGTPRYMAPEQFIGEAMDARSDQFSFCVALWEALYREWPFPGQDVEALAASVVAGSLRDPPAGSPVPPRIRAALARGLAASPADRHPSMDELLDELSAAPRRRRIGWIAAAAALAAGAVVVALWLGGASDDEALCTGSAGRFDSVWNRTRRDQVERAFAATHLPYAAGAADTVAGLLDRYRERWMAMHREACEATRVRGEQPEDVMRQRMICLERRLKEVSALLDLDATADAAVVEASVGATYRLIDVDACADVAALTAMTPPPTDPARAARLSAITDDLARARALRGAGKFAAGLALARPAATAARVLGSRPLEAEALLLEGELAHEDGDRAAAEKSLNQAVYAAEAGKHDAVAARAWTDLVFLIGYENAQHARGVELASHARAAIERLGGDAEVEGTLEKALGAIEADQGHDDAAVGHFERALALLERALGPDHPAVATAIDNLGMASLAQGRLDRALELHRRALAIRERTVGGEHPSVASSLQNLGNVHHARGEYAEAEKFHRRALALLERTVGPEHADVSAALTDLARAVRLQGRLDEALALDERALALGEKLFGPKHPAFAAQLINAGVLLKRLGRHDEALAYHQRAAAIFREVFGAEHPEVAHASLAMGDVHLARGQAREALSEYRFALPILEKAYGADQPQILVALISIGQAELALGQPARAIEPLERAERMQPATAAPDDRGAVRFLLARALWDARRDRRRARDLANAARADYARAGDGFKPQVDEVDRWLTRHPAR
jgi:tetratricopeptide (TPR) repeat protein